jgi:hypothetical protein
MTHGLTIQERDARDNLTGDWRYSTPDEIKAAHPKCGSCRWAETSDEHNSHGDIETYEICSNIASPYSERIYIGYCESVRQVINHDTDYCPHHQPKEQP